MGLQGALFTAVDGLRLVSRQASVLSRNVSNAGTPDYTVKRVTVEALAEGGVRVGETTRQVDASLRTEARIVRGQSAHAEVLERALNPLVALNGSPGAADSISDLVTALRDSLTSLRARPSDLSDQRSALRIAGDLSVRLNELAAAVGRARQAAQDELARQVSGANRLTQQIARLDAEARATRAGGAADSYTLDRRDAAIQQLSELLDVTPAFGARDQVTLILRGGYTLPLEPGDAPFSIASGPVTPEAYYGAPDGTLPALMLGEIDITSLTRNGRMGALLDLRDTILPQMQAELDILASTLATRFDAQGLRLFTDRANATAAPPDVAAGAGYSGSVVGFAGRITVSMVVSTEPRLLRDGTHGAPVTGFEPNPAGGPTGFTGLLDNLLNYTFGIATGPGGTPHPRTPIANLGPGRDLAASFNPPIRLVDHAAAMTGSHAVAASEATTRLTETSASRTRIDLLLQQREGVDVDQEMAGLLQLQNAYAANARVLAAVQEMWDALLRVAR